MSSNSIGSLLGAGVGWLIGGPVGARWGFMIGGTLAGIVDPQKIKGPRLSDATRQTSMEGIPIPWGYGTFPTTGNIIFAGPLVEHEHEEGGKGGPTTVTYTYTRSYAIGICEGPISGIQKIKRNGKLVYDISPTSTITAENAKFLEKCTIYLGDETQNVDPTIEAIKGVGATGPYRGLAYIVMEDDDLTESQGAIAQYEFVVQMCGTVTTIDSGLMSFGPEFWYPLNDGGGSLADATTNHGPLAIFNDGSSSGDGFNTGDGTGAARIAGLTSLNLGGAAGGECATFIALTLHTEPAQNCWLAGEITNSITGLSNWSLHLTDAGGTGPHRYLQVRVNGAGGGGTEVRSTGLLPLGVPVVCGLRCRADMLECLVNGKVVASTPCVGGLLAGGSATVMVNEYFFPPGDQFTVSNWIGVRRAVTDSDAALITYTMGIVPDGYYAVPDVPGALVDVDGNVIVIGGSTITTCQAVLSDIVEDLCFRAGLDVATEVDASELTDLVDGFKCATESGADQFIESLTMSHFFDRAEWDKKLRFPKRGGPVVAALTMDDVTLREGAPIEQTRIQEPELLRKVNVLSIDSAADYNVTKQTWERRAGTIKAVGEASVEIPEVVATDTAAQIAEIRGKIAWSETDKFKFGYSVKWSKLTPTDPITLTDRGGIVHRMRLQDVNEELGAFSVEEAVKDRASVYSSSAVGVTNTNTSGPTSPGVVGPTLLAVMNLPQMRTQDGPGVWVGMAGITAGWKGGQLIMSVDSGASYTPVLTVTTPTKMGPLTADVDAIGSASEPLSVHIYGGQLSNATTAQVAAGINTSAVDTGGVAEVLAYETATESPADYYALSVLTRGIKETTVADHFIGDMFMDLSTAWFVPIDQNYAGQTLYFKAVAFGVSADAVDSIAVVFDGTTYVLDGGGA